MVQEYQLRHAVVAANNDRAAFVWDMVMAVALDCEFRNLEWFGGHTRSVSLLLHDSDAVATAYISDVKADWENYHFFKDFGQDWSTEIADRSPFETPPVLQLALCCEKEGWETTIRQY